VVSSLLGAVDKLLLGERFELSVLVEVSSLNGSGSGEGPARSTMSLVLHWGDGSLGSPVDLIGEVGLVELNFVSDSV